MNMKGQEDTLGSVMIKRTEDFQQEIQMLIQQQDQLHHHHEEPSQNEEKCREQKRSLKWLEEKCAISDFFQGRLDLGKNKENLKTKSPQIDENSKKFKQLEKDNNKQQTLLNTKQNLMIMTTRRLEGEIQKLQKQLSYLKLSNKNMKTQLTRVNALKDITIQKLKLRQHLIEVEAMKGKAVMKTGDLKTTVDSAKQEHVDFRETIMKMLGFNMKAADKEMITHLKLIIRAYDTSNKSKIDSDCENGQNKA
ncbi:coiled-coil domain-containing protein 170-like [Saccopteryx leptura]|uniref:coiled-coil domain-containing protein 170-like n=1 Tax=Saccopteryx leptura TaxID=249018 RepID=UPI00339D0433